MKQFRTPSPDRSIMRRVTCVAFMVAPLLVAGGLGAQTSGTMPREATTRSTAAMDSMETIVNLLVVANADEIEAGKVALAKAMRADVKAYAQRIIDEHTMALRQLTDSAGVGSWNRPDSSSANASGMRGLGGQYSVNAMRGDSLAQLQRSNPAGSIHAANLEVATKLKAAAAPDFDRMYLSSQAEGHEMLLKTLDKYSTSNAKLQAMVTAMKATVQDHLTVVHKLQTGNARSTSR